jgi:hypothetical protein
MTRPWQNFATHTEKLGDSVNSTFPMSRIHSDAAIAGIQAKSLPEGSASFRGASKSE